jgi:cell wall assembly regulator SMI1
MSHRMGRKFDRHQILRQKDPWEVARNVFDIALELALLGYIDAATDLYNLFEGFSQGCKSSWSPGLYFAWEATGLWPESISVKDRAPEVIAKLETERTLWKRDTNATPEGLEKLIKTATGGGKMDEFGDAQLRSDDLTAAIDLALFMGDKEKALEILKTFADNFHATWVDLSKSRQVWQLLKDKTLARLIEVDEDKVEAFIKDVYATFEERLRRGALRVYLDTPVPELVKMCNDNTMENAVWEEMDEIDPDNPPTCILRPGASENQIVDLEKKLGHDLPSDFKEFLSLTNGMESYWNGFYGEPRFLGTNEIEIFNASEQQEIWNEASVDIAFITNMSVKVDWPTLDRVIAINAGSESSKFVWLIEPEVGQKIGGAWFAAFQQLPPEEQAHVQQMMGYFHAGKENAGQVDWQVAVWDPSTLDLTSYHSWKEYLEKVAGDTANADILDEEDEEGRLMHSHDIIAYQLR